MPKVNKGPLKSIMKKKEEKAKEKDRIHRKESDVSGTSLTASGGRKGSHFKEFLEMHSAKSPKHSVSVSTGLSVSVNGDTGGGGDATNAVSAANIVRSNSSSRSVFEMAEAPKDAARTSSQVLGVEVTSFSQDDAVGRGLRNGGKQQSHHSKVLNGAPVAADASDGTGSQNDEDEEDGPIFTQL